jgi:hypothetical protein
LGAFAGAPAASLLTVALAGAVAGQASVVTESVVDEALSDGENFSGSDVTNDMLENWFGNLIKMVVDGGVAVFSVGVGDAVADSAEALGILSKTTSSGYQQIKTGFVSGGGTSYQVITKQITLLQTNSAVAVNTMANKSIDVLEEVVSQSITEAIK